MFGELSGGPTSEIERLATGANPFTVLLSVKLSVFWWGDVASGAKVNVLGPSNVM